MTGGWIKLHRQFMASPYFTESVAVHVWVACLLRAAHKPKDFFLKRERITLQPGQFVMGRKEFGESIGISGSTAWYWLLQFEADSMVDIRKTAKGSIVSVKNWVQYQDIDSTSDKGKTADEQQIEPNKKDKNDKKEKNILSSPKKGPRPSVEKIMLAMHECFGTLDRTETENRRYAWLLIQRAMKGPPESSEDRAADLCCALITAARKSDWWGEHITCVQDIYRNARKIAASLREQESTKAVFIS